LNLHLSGGVDGLRHVLDHLGPPIESWWNDFKPVTLDEATKAKLVASSAQLTDKLDLPETVSQRDDVLSNLLRDKASKDALP
jgi:carnitine 3-dehydrogenase